MIGFLFYLFILFVLYTAGWHSAFWVFIIVPAFIFIASLFSPSKNSQPKDGTLKHRTRIDHPHYMSLDEYECTVCGRRFGRNTMVCPHCGVRFTRTETDEDEFDDEYVFWEDD